jgi:hypothetical protein
VQLLISASNEQEYLGWTQALADAIAAAKENPVDVDAELTPMPDSGIVQFFPVWL